MQLFLQTPFWHAVPCYTLLDANASHFPWAHKHTPRPADKHQKTRFAQVFTGTSNTNTTATFQRRHAVIFILRNNKRKVNHTETWIQVKFFSLNVITLVYNYMMLFQPKETGYHYKNALYVPAHCLYYVKRSHICKYLCN